MGNRIKGIRAIRKRYPVMKQLIIMVLLLALTMTITACGGGVDKAVIDDMAAKLTEATVLYDEGDYLAAAKLIQTQRETFAVSGSKLSYRNALCLAAVCNSNHCCTAVDRSVVVEADVNF